MNPTPTLSLGGIELALDPLLIVVPGADEPETASSRHGGRQAASRDGAHGGQKHRVLNG